MMRILIADDHHFIRKGIRETLAEELGLHDVVEAADGLEAYEFLTKEKFDLAIVDISMPGKGGLDLIKDVMALRPHTRFLVMSVYPEREFAERSYRNGAMGYLIKSSSPEQFIDAVRRILAGKRYVSPEYAELLVQGLGGGPAQDERLSDRELSVITLYAEGKNLSEIGEVLHLSVKTVSTYKTRAMDKLGLDSNAQLISYAVSRGWKADAAL
jgi:DNA-binding NarL/FixJ family response regulator